MMTFIAGALQRRLHRLTRITCASRYQGQVGAIIQVRALQTWLGLSTATVPSLAPWTVAAFRLALPMNIL